MIVKQSSINIDDELRLFGSALHSKADRPKRSEGKKVYYQKSRQIKTNAL